MKGMQSWGCAQGVNRKEQFRGVAQAGSTVEFGCSFVCSMHSALKVRRCRSHHITTMNPTA